MKQATYFIGSEYFRQWLDRHGDVGHLIITGKASAEEMDSLADVLDYRRFRIVSLREISVDEIPCDTDGSTISYSGVIEDKVLFDHMPVRPLEKMYMNSAASPDFIIEDGDIYSLDRTTLIHSGSAAGVLRFDSGVRRIGNYAFTGNEDICEVRFHDGIESIGDCAFTNASRLSSVTLPDSVTKLGVGAFNFCDIRQLKLASSLKEIPYGCFGYNPLLYKTDLEIPSSVISIGDCAFQCAELGKVTLHEGLERIGCDVFEDVAEIDLPSTLGYIAPDFYYEEEVDDGSHPPYVRVSPLNTVFCATNGSLYFKSNGELALNHTYNPDNSKIDKQL